MSDNRGSDPDPGYTDRARAERDRQWARRKAEAARGSQNQTTTTGRKARGTTKGGVPA